MWSAQPSHRYCIYSDIKDLQSHTHSETSMMDTSVARTKKVEERGTCLYPHCPVHVCSACWFDVGN